MTHAPRLPREQLSFAGKGARSDADAAAVDRRDLRAGAQSGHPGDVDVNLDTRGRFGNLKQNLTNQWKVQDR